MDYTSITQREPPLVINVSFLFRATLAANGGRSRCLKAALMLLGQQFSHDN
jgi:hypothetical protein